MLFRSKIAENSAFGKLVGTLSAVGGPVGATPTFSLIDSAGGLFAINGTSLTVAGALDYETATSHEIVVRVSGGGTSFDETITISVTDVAGVVINGTSSNNTVSATKTVLGQALPTAEQDTIYGNGCNDNLSALGGEDRKSTRLNSSHMSESRMPSSA